ncbi:MAG TPA: GIY-YIG nuclease family protein, partial [Rubrivivax sp.]|nr:GIY-YIG nuclease family protein [Rubrivivax sp.]
SDRNILAVQAIHEDSLLVRRMPDWQTLAIGWSELQLLPARWRQSLGQWRGLYYIFDTKTGKGYVGSAGGSENLLGRWTHYAANGHGGNRLLRALDPETFVFSILQRVSPDTDSTELVRIENQWKTRLHSRAPFRLNDN